MNFGKCGQIKSAMNWQLKADKEAHTRLLILSMLTPADDIILSNVPELVMVSVDTVELLAATRLTPLCVVLELAAEHVDSPSQQWQLDMVAERFLDTRCDIWKKIQKIAVSLFILQCHHV